MTPWIVSLLFLAAPPTASEVVVQELGVPTLASVPELEKKYLPDEITIEQVRKSPEKYPVRIAVLNAADNVRKTYKLTPKLEILQPRLEVEKKAITEFQEDLAAAILLMKESTAELNKVVKKRDEEKSPRWQADLDYLLAFVKFRTGTLEELNLAYGIVHRNELPTIDESKKHTGWALKNVEKMHSKTDIRRLVEEAQEQFEAVKKAYPKSPWSALAERDLAVKPGLSWESAEVKPPPPVRPEIKKKKP